MRKYGLLLMILFLFGIPKYLYALPPAKIERRALLDLLVPRKPIDLRKIGLNSFANEPIFGSVKSQLAEVKNRLGVRHIRILFAWNNDVQSSPSVATNYAFYDDIANNIPAGVSALVILTGLPTWARTGPDPSTAFIERWVKPTVLRYKANARIGAFQLWNEPNDSSNPDNLALTFQDPNNYLATLAQASSFIKTNAPGKMVVNAATTAIGQNYPKTLNYNKVLLAGGVTNLVDRFAIHYYGDNYHNVILPDGIASTLSAVQIPIWVTESGRQGATKQREYVERAWPFLSKYIPRIERFYLYQFTEGTPAKTTYGLRFRGGISDLYRIIARSRTTSKVKK